MVVKENNIFKSITCFYLNLCFLTEMCGNKEGGKLFLQVDPLFCFFFVMGAKWCSQLQTDTII